MNARVLISLSALVVLVALLIPGEVRTAGLALLVVSIFALGFWICYKMAEMSDRRKNESEPLTTEASAEEVA